MDKIPVFLGSPRRKGNSEALADAVIRGIEEAGGKAEVVRLVDYKIAPCIGCGGCDKTGKCVIIDDMQQMCEKIINARRLIIVSPIYFYSVTAQTKAFIDRCQALWNRKRLLKKKGEWQEDPDRKGYLVSVAATRGEKVFDGAVLTMIYTCDAMGIGYGGGLLVRGVDSRGEMKKDSANLEKGIAFGRDCLK
ncbi:MAG: flavodoxin family protein [Proteobacteria bacterium]|nr:flavodoxin family protein [Pseudomonadota bacterium]MBU1738534.1 flavodoxin family protein [Pseudomonadota bacterium]